MNTKRVIGVLALLILFSIHLASARPLPQAMPANGKLVISAAIDGVGRIFTINPDGTDMLQVTSGPEYAYSAVWSPDGSSIAFDSTGGLFRIDGQGNGIQPIPNGDGLGEPDWSPDGRHLVAVWSYDLVMIDLINNTRQSLVIPGFREDAFNQEPVWSPDGNRILVASSGSNQVPRAVDGNPQMDLFIVNRDGSNPIQLTAISGGRYGGLNWLSDDRIVFSARILLNGQGVRGVFAYDLATNSLVLLSDPSVVSRLPAVSPDETQIAFAKEPNRVAIMNIDGTNVVTIAEIGGNIQHLDWQPLRNVVVPTPTPTMTPTPSPTPTPTPTPPPSTLLDDFERADGAVGGS